MFCEVSCPACDRDYGSCEYDGSDEALCVCDKTSENSLVADGNSAPNDPLAGDARGVGYTGADCSIPCVPCFNGTCSTAPGTKGECVCEAGYSSPACLIECGVSGVSALTGEELGSRGTLNRTGAPLGKGLAGVDPATGLAINTTHVCECDYMFAGPLCEHDCPWPYDADHERCVLKPESDPDYGLPYTTEILCDPGWTGRPPPQYLLDPSSPSPLLNCPERCRSRTAPGRDAASRPARPRTRRGYRSAGTSRDRAVQRPDRRPRRRFP